MDEGTHVWMDSLSPQTLQTVVYVQNLIIEYTALQQRHIIPQEKHVTAGGQRKRLIT